jgi:hypothetical protein
MDLQRLSQHGGAWLHILPATPTDAYDLMRLLDVQSAPQIVARWIRGGKCRTAAGLFDEFAAALQFPWYFGGNWDALDECLSDLEWLPADGYALFVADAVAVLADEPAGQFRTFCDVLHAAAANWSGPDHGVRPRPPRAFHVVLQTEPAREAELRARLNSAGAFPDRPL